MKKTYMIPTLQVVKVQPAQILAGSEIGKGEEFDAGRGDVTLSRRARFSDWDEDFDEE